MRGEDDSALFIIILWHPTSHGTPLATSLPGVVFARSAAGTVPSSRLRSLRPRVRRQIRRFRGSTRALQYESRTSHQTGGPHAWHGRPRRLSARQTFSVLHAFRVRVPGGRPIRVSPRLGTVLFVMSQYLVCPWRRDTLGADRRASSAAYEHGRGVETPHFTRSRRTTSSVSPPAPLGLCSPPSCPLAPCPLPRHCP